MSDNGNGLMRKTYMVEPVQDAIVKATAKDNGNSSESAALRSIIDEWARMKAIEAGIPIIARQPV